MIFGDEIKMLVSNKIEKFRYRYKNIPCGYVKGTNGGVSSKLRKVLEVTLVDTDLDWLKNLDYSMVIQIGDTFYKKRGLEFVEDYNNMSSAYEDNLFEMLVDKTISIMYDGVCS